MQANIKTKNGKKLKVKALVDSRYMHTGINEQLVKDKTNPEDLLEYIQPFTHLFNKKKFKKLPERCK